MSHAHISVCMYHIREDNIGHLGLQTSYNYNFNVINYYFYVCLLSNQDDEHKFHWSKAAFL
jgi:hypothetical protein